MLIQLHLFLLILCFFVPAFSQSLPKQNDFCEFYEKMDDDNFANSLREEELDKPIYQFSNRKDLVIYARDIKNWRYSIMSHVLDDNADEFSRKMFYMASVFNIDSKAKYYHALPIKNTTSSEEKLNSCFSKNFGTRQLSELNKASRQQSVFDPAAYEEFLSIHILAAIQASAYLKKKGWIEQEFRDSRADLRSRYLSRLERGIHQEYDAKIRELDELEKATLEVSMQGLYKIMESYPLLFELSYQPEFFSWLNRKIVAGEFMKELLAGIDEDILETLRDRFLLDENLSDLGDIFLSEEVVSLLNPVFLEKFESESLRSLASKKAENYIKILNEKTLNLCEEKENKLHYSYDLVEATWLQNSRHKDFKSLTVKDQAAFCHLNQLDPARHNKTWGAQEKLGLYSFASGSILSFFTGYGKLVKGLFLLGTGSFVHNTWDEYAINKLELATHYTILPYQFSSIEKIEELESHKGNLVLGGVLDLALGIGGAGFVHLLDQKFSVALARKYDGLKSWFPKLSDRLAVHDLILRAKARQGLFIEGNQWARGKLEYLHTSRAALFKKLDEKYNIVNFRRYRNTLVQRLGNNLEMPAYFIYSFKKSILGELDAILNVSIARSPAGAAKVETFLEGVKAYMTESALLTKYFDQKFTALVRKPYLDRISKIDERAFIEKQTQDFGDLGTMVDGVFTAKIPAYKNGKLVQEDYVTNNPATIKADILEVEAMNSGALPANMIREFRSQSVLDQELLEGAKKYRLYSILIHRLEEIKLRDSLTVGQQNLLEVLKETVKQEPNFEKLFKVLNKELIYEFYDLGLNMIPFVKRNIFGSIKKIENHDLFSYQIQKIAPVFNWYKGAFLLGVSSAGWGILKNMFDYGTYFHLSKEKVFAAWRSGVRYLIDYTLEEKDCAESILPIHFDLCFYKLANEEIGYYRALNIRDKNYHFHKDLDAKKKLRKFIYRILKLRSTVKIAEAFGFVKDANNEVTERLIVEKIAIEVGLVLESAGGSPEFIGDVVYGLFYSEDDDEKSYFKTELKRRFPEHIYYAILDAETKKEVLIKRMKESGDLPGSLLDSFVDDSPVEIDGDKNKKPSTMLDFFRDFKTEALRLIGSEKNP